MDNKVLRYSIPWRITFAVAVPLIFILVLIYLRSTGSSLHFNSTMVLLGLSLVPYFFLIFKFAEKYILGETQITQKNFFVTRTLKWKAIIEYRDFFNLIVLMPLVVSKSFNIYFYRNIRRYEDLRTYLSDRSRVFEVNKMRRRRDRLFLIIDIGTLPVLLIILVAAAAVVWFSRFPWFDLRVLLTAATSGMFFVLTSVTVWLLLQDLTQFANRYSHVIATIMTVTIVVPLIVIAAPALKKTGLDITIFLGTYILGYAMGWGGMSAFFPNREKQNRNSNSQY